MGELSKKVASQEIKVDSAFELDSAKFNEILNSAKAK
jgi:hypothetical protein